MLSVRDCIAIFCLTSVKICRSIRIQEFLHLNAAEQKAVGQTDSQLLAIAGRCSGKILVLVMRALNILLQGLAEPREVLLCAFTEVDLL